jgi:transcription elongation factor SPT5
MSSDASPFGNSTPIGSDFGKLPSIAGSSSTNIGSSQWTPTSPAGSTNPNASPFPAHGGAGGNDEPTLPDNIRVKLLTDGRQGTIAEVDGASYGIEVEPGEPLIKVRREEIEVVRPAKKDRLVIIKGELRGHTGTLIGIDGTDGIVKMTTNSDIKILDLKSCAKLADVLG